MTERERLQSIKTLPSLIKYLRDELDWPIDRENVEDLFFEYEPEELGIDPKLGAQIKEIKQLRPLESRQPWGIFYINFEPKRLPIVVLRKILGALVLKKRASAAKAERPAWQTSDLLFISSYGESGERAITFAHFGDRDQEKTSNIPTLRVLGWDDQDTVLTLEHVHKTLQEKLRWPTENQDLEEWRKTWSDAFELRPREVITTANALALTLADLAKRICGRAKLVLRVESATGPLRKLHAAFKEALIHDLTEDDFADMYAQTVAYGLLAARVSRPMGISPDNLADMVPVTNPFLRDMLSTFLTVGGRKGKIDFDELGIQEVIDLLNSPDTHMDAVLRDFDNRNPQEDPVIHFYEHFLAAYDKKRKVSRGVFYTPKPVVSYIVRSVHELLQTEFDLEDGLASILTWGEMAKRNPSITLPDGIKPDEPFVQILDPATGTATFLVTTIEVVHQTMMSKWEKQGLTERARADAWDEYVPNHLLPRLYGYELMMAPYAIAHMKVGLALTASGFRWPKDFNERARIYLTNSLEPPQDFSDRLAFDAPALAHEAQAVNGVKRHQRFTVVIGNPPYARHSSNPNRDSNGRLTFIGRLVEEYKEGCPELRKPAQAKYLQDDYVKFTRFAEHIVLATDVGVIGLITNHGFLDNPTFRGMRNHLLCRLAETLVLDLHGNANKKEKAPDGSEDKNVFDIKQGVAILIATRTPSTSTRKVLHGDLWGSREGKYHSLMSSSRRELSTTPLNPKDPQFSLCPRDESNEAEYLTFASVAEIFSPNGAPAPGIVTTHDSFAVAFSESEIVANVETLLRSRNESEAREHFRLCTQDQWKYAVAKRELADDQWRKKVIPLHYRPFDTRFTVYDSNVAVHRRERVTRHLVAGGNLAMLTSRMTKGETFKHVQVTHLVPEVICMSPLTSNNGFVFPLWLKDDAVQARQSYLLGENKRPNLGREFLDRLRFVLNLEPSGTFGVPASLTPEDIFRYAYAVFHSPGYRSRYAEFLKTDFPRLPLTGNLELFRALARLGGELVDLHLLESPKLGTLITEFIGGRHPEVEKVSWSKDTVWVDKAQITGFRGVPESVWNFHIGGYQVCEKWLKDRKGRTLSDDDITHYQKIVVALNETIRLMSEIDEVIDQHGGWPAAFLLGQIDTNKSG